MDDGRLVIFCLVPERLADDLLGDLSAHFARDDRVRVIVDRRYGERRGTARAGRPARSAAEEAEDRRTGRDRRRPVLPRFHDALPDDLRERAAGVVFVQRMLPVSGALRDAIVDEVVAAVRAGDPEAPTELYWRVYERVHSRLCVLLGDAESADRAAPLAFGRILDALEDPANAGAPFDPLLYSAVDAGFANDADAPADEDDALDGDSLAITDPKLDEPVVVHERDPRWFGRAREERARIMRDAGEHLVAAEHIGSTGVPAIAARPIVDLILGVKQVKEPAALRAALLALGYERCGSGGTKGRAYYRKRGVTDFDVHVVKYDGPLWRDAVELREYLRRSPMEAGRWAAVKREAARTAGHSSMKYARLRAPAMRELIARSAQSSQRAA